MIDGGGKYLAITAEVDVSIGVDAHAGFGNLGVRNPMSEDDTRDENFGRISLVSRGTADAMAAKPAINEMIAEVLIVR